MRKKLKVAAVLHPSGTSWAQSILEGCHFCGMLWHLFVEEGRRSDRMVNTTDPAAVIWDPAQEGLHLFRRWRNDEVMTCHWIDFLESRISVFFPKERFNHRINSSVHSWRPHVPGTLDDCDDST